MIHPTAVIHPGAQLDASVEVSPYAVIDGQVIIGPGCRVGPHVYITGRTRIGANNRLFAGCVLGEAPQDVKYKDEPTDLRVGDGNMIREGATIHRSAKPDGCTVIGSNTFIMANAHVAHDCTVGDYAIIANGALLGGYVELGTRAFISGNCLVHQFVRVGTLALMQGGSAVSQDVPPFTMIRGVNTLSGLNTIGLRRAGLTAEERLELRRLFQQLFRSGDNLRAALEKAENAFHLPPSRTLLEFIRTGKRGICREAVIRAGRPETGDEADVD